MNLEIEKVFLTNEFKMKESPDSGNQNTDVIVELTSGNKYIASFFSFQNLEAMRQENLKSGAFLNGKYFWAKNMLLIDECSENNVKLVIKNLIRGGDFNEVFQKI